MTELMNQVSTLQQPSQQLNQLGTLRKLHNYIYVVHGTVYSSYMLHIMSVILKKMFDRTCN